MAFYLRCKLLRSLKPEDILAMFWFCLPTLDNYKKELVKSTIVIGLN